MKKNIILSAITSSIALFSVINAGAQSVGVGTTTPSPRAALEVKQGASPQGLLIPKMDNTSMTTLAGTLLSPQDLGMVIYNTASKTFMYWDGVSFKNMGGTATVSSVATGIGLTGGPITTSGTISLANTTVAAGTYGSGSVVPVVTVDAQGRITSASTTPISALPALGVATEYLAGDKTWKNFNTSARAAFTGTTPVQISAAGVISLANSGVTAGTYGSATQYPKVTVDALGRITSVAMQTVATSPWTISSPNIEYSVPTGKVIIGSTTEFGVDGSASMGNTEISGTLDVTGLGSITTLQDLDVVGDVVFDQDVTFDQMASAVSGVVLADNTGLVSKLNFTGTVANFLRADGTWAPALGDDLGSHVATKNVVLKNFWVSGDGSDNGMFVNATGEIGIGTTSKNGRLNILTNGGTELFFETPTGDKANIQCKEAIVLETLGNAPLHFFTNATSRMEISGAGNVAIGGAVDPNYKLYVYGKLKSDGITEISDRRLKQDITTLSGSLDKLGQLRGVSYNWIQNNEVGIAFEKGIQIGLIAQEVEAVFPALVDTDSNGYKSVEYSKLVAVLIEAIKEQQAQIESLETKVGGLEEVKAEIESLKATLNKYSMK